MTAMADSSNFLTIQQERMASDPLEETLHDVILGTLKTRLRPLDALPNRLNTVQRQGPKMRLVYAQKNIRQVLKHVPARPQRSFDGASEPDSIGEIGVHLDNCSLLASQFL